MTRLGSAALVILLLSLTGAHIARAAESYDNCTGFVTSLPTTISTPGTWCFNQNLSTAATGVHAVTLNSDNITLDCNDFKLDGLAAGASTQSIGVYAGVRHNLTVRHCNIRGFYFGIQISGAGTNGHKIEDNRFDGNTYSAMLIDGDGAVIRRNRVFDTGGSTQTTYAYAIFSSGTADVLDNTVSGVVAGTDGIAAGIYTAGNPGGSITGNRVRGVVQGSGSGQAWGIFNSSSDRIILRDNDVQAAAATGTGLYCANSNGRARDNAIKGFSGAIVGCSNDGGNVIKP